MSRPSLQSWVAGLTLAAVAGPGWAAGDVLLKIDGLRGPLNDVRHPGAILLTSYGQGIRATYAQMAGGGGGGGAGKVQCADFSLGKAVDATSPELLKIAATGRHVPTAWVIFRHLGPEPFDYYVVRLSDVIIDSVDQSHAQPHAPSDAVPQERLSLRARQIQYTYRVQNPDGSAGADTSFGWDCVANAPMR